MDEIKKAVFVARTRDLGRSTIIVVPQSITMLGFEQKQHYRFTIEKIDDENIDDKDTLNDSQMGD